MYRVDVENLTHDQLRRGLMDWNDDMAFAFNGTTHPPAYPREKFRSYRLGGKHLCFKELMTYVEKAVGKDIQEIMRQYR
jgi:hypothetical protein